MKKYLIIPLALLAFFCFAPKTHAAFSYYRSITVTSSASVASGTNSNFPMLVSSTLTSWESTSTGAGARIQNLCTAPSGVQEPCDLVFVTSTPTASGANWNCGTALNFETESYTSSTGALVDWVNVPTVATGTVIYACYGDSTVTTDQSHPSSTWDANYKGVWHLGEKTMTVGSTLKDSTANGVSMRVGNDGSVTDAIPTSTSKIGGGAYFTSPNQYSGASASSSLNSGVGTSTNLTLESWTKFNSAQVYDSAYNPYLDTGTAYPYNIVAFYAGNNNANVNFEVFDNAGSPRPAGSASTSIGTWYHVVGTYDGSTLITYLNGALASSSAATFTRAGDAPMYFAYGKSDGGRWTDAVLDEVRISNTTRSSQWVATEYNNQNSPSTFYAVGSETAGSAGGSTAPLSFNQVLAFDW